MKQLLILTAAALALTACGNAVGTGPTVKTTVQNAETQSVETKTKVVLLYAGWCGSCKILDPAVSEAQSMDPLPGVEFVVLNYTDKNKTNFYAQAQAAGVETAVRTYLDGKVKTGLLLLIDVDDEKVIDTLTKKDTAPVILAKIKSAAAAS